MTKARRLTAVLVAGGLGVALAGCSAQQPGAAAVVDGRAIPSSDVRDVLTELAPYFQGATTPNVISVLVQEPVVVQMASEKGVGVSDEQAAKLLADSAKQAGAKNVHFSAASLDVARYSVALQNLTNLGDATMGEVTKRLDQQHVKVNPRFGSTGRDLQVHDPVPWPWLHAAPAAK